MLPKQRRIRKSSEYKRIFQDGKVVFSDIFIFKYLENNEDMTRFGIIVSTKVSKKAVKRNKVKRQISAILELMLKDVKEGYDCAIMVKKGIGDTFKFHELKKQIQHLFKKGNLLK